MSDKTTSDETTVTENYETKTTETTHTESGTPVVEKTEKTVEPKE